MKVRLLCHGPMKGKFNMAVDEGIQNAVRRGEACPTLRFYEWEPACLSLGYFQDVDKEVDIKSLERLGVDLVRRPTGGKAVLHDDELTYSVAIPERDLPGTVLETYKLLSEAIVNGLRSLGVAAEMVSLERGVTVRDSRFQQAACFSAPSWYEVVALGKKIVGSAQVRRGGIILQHGSIPFHMDAAKVVKCLKTSSQAQADRLESMLSNKSAGLCQVCNTNITRRDVEASLVLSFTHTLGWNIEKGYLTKDEIQESLELSQNKYGQESWTMTRGKQSADIDLT
ncbi:MAG: lipoate--protein ligase family protein [Firmicutes bacterium]|nr:lipoate--protein ligase family protein [Candidatus Fermentithermobacillaceae bacterium]